MTSSDMRLGEALAACTSKNFRLTWARQAASTMRLPGEQLVEAGIAVSVDRAGKCLQVALRMLPFCDWASRRTVPLAGARPRAITWSGGGAATMACVND